MYKYDKENDRIIKTGGQNIKAWECISMERSQLEALREALGLKKRDEQKYTVQILSNYKGFLNCEREENYYTTDTNEESLYFKTHFTQAEIDKLKRCDDLAIDWDKAIIKPVEDD